jgi:uncharacterized protein (TIGR00730 family)
MHVTIFGGANPLPTDPAYAEAERLGRLLAQAGHAVLTGGYIGTMEAASKGAAEAGGHVIGVTCEEIERWRGVKANPWVKEEWRCQTLDERLVRLMDSCQAAIALPGGVGTLVEIVLLWNRMLIQATPARPLILVGQGWQKTIQTFLDTQDGYVTAPHRHLVQFAPTVGGAVELLK